MELMIHRALEGYVLGRRVTLGLIICKCIQTIASFPGPRLFWLHVREAKSRQVSRQVIMSVWEHTYQSQTSEGSESTLIVAIL